MGGIYLPNRTWIVSIELSKNYYYYYFYFYVLNNTSPIKQTERFFIATTQLEHRPQTAIDQSSCWQMLMIVQYIIRVTFTDLFVHWLIVTWNLATAKACTSNFIKETTHFTNIYFATRLIQFDIDWFECLRVKKVLWFLSSQITPNK